MPTTTTSPQAPPAFDAMQPIPLADIVFQYNIRKLFDDESLQGLADSIREVGVLMPIRVRPDGGKFSVIDGERRVRASRLAGLTMIPAIIVARELSNGECCREQLITNCQREGLTASEMAQALHELKNLTGWSAAQLAAKVGFSGSKVSRLLAMLDWPQDLRERVESGQLAITVAAELAKLSDDERARSVAQVTAGQLTRDGLAGARKSRERVVSDDEPKVSRATATLGVGRSVSIAAPSLDLEAFIQLLQELLDKARRSRSQGLELPTFLKVLRDTAKA